MVKTRTDKHSVWYTPSIVVVHSDHDSPPSYTPFPYHTIWLHNAPYALGYLTLWTNPPPDWEPLTSQPTDQQLALVRMLVANPHIICDLCSDCRKTNRHPWIPRWNLFRGDQYRWSTPACPADGSWPPAYTPDNWPPAWF